MVLVTTTTTTGTGREAKEAEKRKMENTHKATTADTEYRLLLERFKSTNQLLVHNLLITATIYCYTHSFTHATTGHMWLEPRNTFLAANHVLNHLFLHFSVVSSTTENETDFYGNAVIRIMVYYCGGYTALRLTVPFQLQVETGSPSFLLSAADRDLHQGSFHPECRPRISNVVACVLGTF